MATQKTAILTPKAPQPIGPYSQAIKAGDFLFCSGQIAIDPATGQMLDGDVQAQAKLAMKNVQALLESAGVTFDAVVKTTIFLKSMGDFAKVNEVYGTFFQGVAPARSTIEVARLPKDALVEVEVIAVLT